MIKVVYVLFKKEGMSGEEWRRYWRETHAPITKKIPGLRKYVQNHALPDPEVGEPEYAGFSEVYFDGPEAMQQALATPEGQATLDDLPNFCDPDRSKPFVVEELDFI